MISLKFHKMEAAGNDFVLLDLFSSQEWTGFSLSGAAEVLCDRRFGAGADGLLTIEPASEAAQLEGIKFRMRMWNPDGTEDMCGNGLRCVAEHAWRYGYAAQENFRIETIAGVRTVCVVEEHVIQASMGQPVWTPEAIPMLPPGEWQRAVDYELTAGNEQLSGVTSLSTGSTHTVIFLNEPLDPVRFEKLSPELEYHPWFPQRTTVLWAEVAGENQFRLRIWERGVGETLACGTGACAVAAAAWTTGRANGPVQLICRGGTLKAECRPDHEILLTGPARQVYTGLWNTSEIPKATSGLTPD